MFPEYEIVFAALVFNPGTPLDELEHSFARVVFIMVGQESVCELACMFFQHGLLFPTYQWVFVSSIPYTCVGEVEFSVLGVNYKCSETEISLSLNEAVVITHSPYIPRNQPLVSGQLLYDYLNTYDHYVQLYSNCTGYNVSYGTVFGDRLYDGVWSLALALNRSVGKMGVNLSEYSYGESEITKIIVNNFYELDFYGSGGRVQYNRSSGARSHPTVIMQVIDRSGTPSSIEIGSFHNSKWNISSAAVFIEDEFKSGHVHLLLTAAVLTLVVAGIEVLLVIAAHLLTVFYHNYKSVKASSPRLNHFVFVGCYLVLFAVVIYTIRQEFHLCYFVHTVFCNLFLWCVSISFTLMFGTVCVKTWRLYYIFVVSRRCRKAGRIADHWHPCPYT